MEFTRSHVQRGAQAPEDRDAGHTLEPHGEHADEDDEEIERIPGVLPERLPPVGDHVHGELDREKHGENLLDDLEHLSRKGKCSVNKSSSKKSVLEIASKRWLG